jgi:hypothetical protein
VRLASWLEPAREPRRASRSGSQHDRTEPGSARNCTKPRRAEPGSTQLVSSPSFALGEKGHFRDNCPNMVEPIKRRSKGKALTSVKTWDDSSSEDEPPRTRSHRSSSRSSWSSHNCLMARGKTSITFSSDDSSSDDDEGEGNPP